MLLLNNQPIKYFYFSGGEIQVKLPSIIKSERVILAWKPTKPDHIILLGLTVKATSAVVNGQRRAIFKNPITGDGSKKSAKGLIRVELDDTGKFFALDQQSEKSENEGCLETVYQDGKLLKYTDLGEIRKNLAIELQRFSE